MFSFIVTVFIYVAVIALAANTIKYFAPQKHDTAKTFDA